MVPTIPQAHVRTGSSLPGVSMQVRTTLGTTSSLCSISCWLLARSHRYRKLLFNMASALQKFIME